MYAEATFVDPPARRAGAHDGGMFPGEALSQFQQADALLHVVRAFENDSVPHVKGSIDWRRDVRDVAFDLTFADISLIDRRVERIEVGMKGSRAAEREASINEIDALKEVQSELESGTPVRAQRLSAAAGRALRDTFLLSALPCLVVVNIGETELTRISELENELAAIVTGPWTGATAICGSLEMELAQMPPGEEEEFRTSLQAGEPALHRVVQMCQRALGLISFLTIGDDRVQAWMIVRGTPAAIAAGKVHTDMERGFIRAEVVGFDDLISAGGFQEARKTGILRAEGREYAMRDGDVVNFRFSV